MALNGVKNKASILDTYNDNKSFGGSTLPGYSDVKEVGGANPKTTDFVKGITPQQTTLDSNVNAASGFTANVKKNGIKDSEYSMVDNKNLKTNDKFIPLNNNKTFSTTKKYREGNPNVPR